MLMICQVNRLELRKCFKFCFAHLPVKWEIQTCMSKKKYSNNWFRHTYYVATATQNLKDYAILVHEHVNTLWTY